MSSRRNGGKIVGNTRGCGRSRWREERVSEARRKHWRTYAFIHNSLEVLGFALNDGNIARSLHTGQGFQLAVDELLGLVFGSGHCESCDGS